MQKLAEKELVSRLAGVPLFSQVSTKHRKIIAKLGKQLDWAAGKTGVVEGSRAQALFLILDGGVEISRAGKPVARMYTDDVFGEAAIVTGGVRNASVTATMDTSFFVLSRTGFAGAVKKHPEIALQLLAAMAERQPPSASD